MGDGGEDAVKRKRLRVPALLQVVTVAVLREPRLWAPRWLFLLAIPGLVSWHIYGVVRPATEAPIELRQMRPALPSKLSVYDTSYDLTTLENPKLTAILGQLQADPKGARKLYDETVAAGREVYYRNCFFCHGDHLDGAGPYAHGYNSMPADLRDAFTDSKLREAFLFWRITTGAPGLPKESTPWNSAMPAWHEMLDEDQVWDVITFLYDYLGQAPDMGDQDISRVVPNDIARELAGQTGMPLYLQRCAVCHGDEGFGDGPAADLLYPRPRDFSQAVFKYKTTPPQQLPSDDDLFATIGNGLPGTGMSGWSKLLSDAQIRSLLPVIKGFDVTAAWAPDDADDEAFDDEGYYTRDDFRVVNESEPLDGQVPFSPESITRGSKVYQTSCKECHGEKGRGNSTSSKKMADDWGYRIWSRDLTKPWTWRVARPVSAIDAPSEQARDAIIKEVYRILSIGITGTPMPAHREVDEGYQDLLNLRDRWHVANFVYTLQQDSVPPADSRVITATRIGETLPKAVDDPRWDDIPATTLHLVPNIIREERLFTPLNDSVTVRAVYDEEQIAFLLEVHDRTDSRPGNASAVKIQDENLELFSDAFAIQFPKQQAFATSPVVTKPHFSHGDTANPTSIWYWNAGSISPFEAPRTVHFDAAGPGHTLLPRPDSGGLTASGRWREGRWRVLMIRSRQSGGNGDIRFDDGRFIPISFANWDGSNGEVASRHTLTSWYWLLLQPEDSPARTYGLPAGSGLLTFLLGFWLVRNQRRRASAPAN